MPTVEAVRGVVIPDGGRVKTSHKEGAEGQDLDLTVQSPSWPLSDF